LHLASNGLGLTGRVGVEAAAQARILLYSEGLKFCKGCSSQKGKRVTFSSFFAGQYNVSEKMDPVRIRLRDIRVRRFWQRNPATRIVTSKKIYNRNREKREMFRMLKREELRGDG